MVLSTATLAHLRKKEISMISKILGSSRIIRLKRLAWTTPLL
jgi:hypothetical protein